MFENSQKKISSKKILENPEIIEIVFGKLVNEMVDESGFSQRNLAYFLE
jgi:hypothetical protein